MHAVAACPSPRPCQSQRPCPSQRPCECAMQIPIPAPAMHAPSPPTSHTTTSPAIHSVAACTGRAPLVATPQSRCPHTHTSHPGPPRSHPATAARSLPPASPPLPHSGQPAGPVSKQLGCFLLLAGVMMILLHCFHCFRCYLHCLHCCCNRCFSGALSEWSSVGVALQDRQSSTSGLSGRVKAWFAGETLKWLWEGLLSCHFRHSQLAVVQRLTQCSTPLLTSGAAACTRLPPHAGWMHLSSSRAACRAWPCVPGGRHACCRHPACKDDVHADQLRDVCVIGHDCECEWSHA